MLDRWKFKLFIIICSTLIFCEFLIYYLVIKQCSWPEFENENDEKNSNLIKGLLLADPHLLGPYRGHWFDKLRREWQMHRSFQTAISLHRPEVVFVLGDLFDEGQWSNRAQYQDYVSRFFSLFNVPDSIKIYVVPGNHDIGFHYVLNQNLVGRFEKAFNISSVQLLNIKQNYFILINSMAMERDNCFFCLEAEKKIKELAAQLNCVKNEKTCKLKRKLQKYSRPIILQHFPMFRKSDAVCNEPDMAPSDIKNQIFRENWDCLSKAASNMIYNKLNPRLIFTGHVHHGCHLIHENDIHEYTLSSFSWRNKNNPSFMLAKFTPNNFAIKKCYMPKESTVIITYISVSLSTALWIIFVLFSSSRRKEFF